MSTSGVTTYSKTTEGIINRALLTLGVIGPGGYVSGDDYAVCLDYLNMMIKHWQTQGLHMWRRTEGILYLTSGQEKYQFDVDRFVMAEGEKNTTTSAASLSGASTITVTSVTGFAATQNIGVKLDDGTIQWTTISSVDSGTKIITLGTTLTNDVASGNRVYTYTTAAGRPLKIQTARYRNSSGNTYKLTSISRNQYTRFPSRTAASGTSSNFWVDKQRTTTDIYLYPVPNVTGDQLEITYDRVIENFVDSDDAADLPDEWMLAVVWNLAVQIAPACGKEMKCNAVPQPGMVSIAAQAAMYLSDIRAWDQETVPSLFITPDLGD